jgi:hypothetical protein
MRFFAGALLFAVTISTSGHAQFRSVRILQKNLHPSIHEALKIVRNIDRRYKKPILDPSNAIPIDLISASKIMIFFNENDSQSVVQKGILNLHQTRAGAFGGDSDENYHPNYTPEERGRFEDSVAGRKLGDPSLYPKYGIVSIHDKEWIKFVLKEGIFSSDNSLYQYDCYGGIIAVLNEEVKARTTFTTSDSLDSFNLTDLKGRDLSKIKTWAKNSVRCAYQEKCIFPKNYQYGTYIEAQVWGAVSLNDIAYFMVSTFFESEKSAQKKTIRILKSSGLPVFQAKCDETPITDLFEEKDLQTLDPGTLEDLKNPLRSCLIWMPGKRL